MFRLRTYGKSIMVVPTFLIGNSICSVTHIMPKACKTLETTLNLLNLDFPFVGA